MTTIILEFNYNTKGGIDFRIIRQDIVNRKEGAEQVNIYSDRFHVISCDYPDITECVLWLRGNQFTTDNRWVWAKYKRRLHNVFNAFLFSCDRFIKPERINL